MQSCALLSSAGSLAVTQTQRDNVVLLEEHHCRGLLLLWGAGLAWH